MVADCLLAAFGRVEHATDEEAARAYSGALVWVECLEELRNIRKLLTAKE